MDPSQRRIETRALIISPTYSKISRALASLFLSEKNVIYGLNYELQVIQLPNPYLISILEYLVSKEKFLLLRIFALSPIIISLNPNNLRPDKGVRPL